MVDKNRKLVPDCWRLVKERVFVPLNSQADLEGEITKTHLRLPSGPRDVWWR